MRRVQVATLLDRAIGRRIHADTELDAVVILAGHVFQRNDIAGMCAIEPRQVVAVGLGVFAAIAGEADVAQEELKIAHLETARATRIGITRFICDQRLLTHEWMEPQRQLRRPGFLAR
jgi:hypothetical protein